MGKITHAELVEMFGDEMPLDAVMLITNAPGEMTADELRVKLRALASQPVPASSDLVERVAMALSETDLCFVKNFSPPWWGEADAQPGDTIRLTEAEKKYWRTLARAIIPIIQADERESCAKVAEGWNGNTRDGDTFLIADAIRGRNGLCRMATAIRERNGSD